MAAAGDAFDAVVIDRLISVRDEAGSR